MGSVYGWGVSGRPAGLILKSLDVPATIAWYTSIGFEVRGAAHDPSAPTWCELARDDLVVQFVSGDTPWPGPPACTGSMYVHPASVRAVFEEITPLGIADRGVEVREWGARELTLRDPNGYYVTFTEPM